MRSVCINLVDLKGLTYASSATDYANALALDGTTVGGETERLSYLARLRHGSGVTVYTGPLGAAFWRLVGPEVRIRVVPDGYDYKERTDNLDEWSYLASGCTPSESRELLARESSPSPKHRLYDRYLRAESLKGEYLRCVRDSAEQIVATGPAVTILTSVNEQLELLGNVPGDAAIDLEWTIDDQRLIGINVSTRDKNWYIPTLARGYDQSQYSHALLDLLAARVKSAAGGFTWHNAKSDFKLLADDPIDLFGSPAHDTILAAYVAGYQSLGLKELTQEVLGRHATPLPNKLEDQPVEVAARYGAAGDSRNTYDLFEVLKRELHDTNQMAVYADIERPLVPMVSSMEKLGFPLDLEEVRRLRDEHVRVEEGLRSHVWAKQRLDLHDYKQQREYVKRLYGYDLGTLNQSLLSRIPDAWMDTLIGYRKVVKVRNDFLDKHLATGIARTYPGFNQAGRDTESGSWVNAPATGRFSSSGPNLQNQPREIRSVFHAPSGSVLVVLDYSGLELVVAAALSQDPVMLEVLRSGGDLHGFMQQRIHLETGVDPGRNISKNANFNLRYGGGADRLVEVAAKARATLDYEIAKSIVEVDRATYGGYWQWYENIVTEARRNGFSETLWGRRRYNADLASSDNTRRSHAERAAANMVVQGTAADIIKIAMGRLPPVLRAYSAHLAVQVHDELVFWVPEENAIAFRYAAQTVMESVSIPHLRLKVEGGIGRSWSDAKLG